VCMAVCPCTDNLPPRNVTCLVIEAFKKVVTVSEGWTWMNEARNDTNARGKWGFTSSLPGSRLAFSVDTRRDGYQEEQAALPLLVHYLKSDRGMGIARAECVSGCLCEPLDIDAGLNAYHSQLLMAAIRVTNHDRCTVQLTLLNQTTSGVHRFTVGKQDESYVVNAFRT
jgi:hypothetical protein